MSFLDKLLNKTQPTQPTKLIKTQSDLIESKLKSNEIPDILKDINKLSIEIVDDIIDEFNMCIQLKPSTNSYSVDVRRILSCYAFNSDIKLITNVTSKYMAKVESLLISRGFVVESSGYNLIIKI
jgi:hypothetical protein